MNIEFQFKTGSIYLIADEHNYILAKAKERTRNGKIQTEYEGFNWYSDLGAVLNRIIDMKCRQSDATSLKELRIDLEMARKEVMAAWTTKSWEET